MLSDYDFAPYPWVEPTDDTPRDEPAEDEPWTEDGDLVDPLCWGCCDVLLVSTAVACACSECVGAEFCCAACRAAYHGEEAC